MTKKNELKEKLFYKSKNGYDVVTADDEAAITNYCEGYKTFLNNSKTERLCASYCIKLAEDKGFKAYTAGMKLKAGDKVYFNNRGKAVIFAVIGKRSLADGVNICGAHIDSPRLDLKPLPLYEDSDLAYLKTCYYGGIRKYHWLALPLEIHGVVVLSDGSSVEVNVGTDPDDPQFVITDLLPHLRGSQDKKNLNNAIDAELLNVLVGSKPFIISSGGSDCGGEETTGEDTSESPKDADEKKSSDAGEKDRVKLGVLKILNEKYGITEEDFISAELEVVPALYAKDIGFDRSLIGGYGQDDRVCAYAELKGLFDAESFEKTGVCIFADKEEIGSMGVTGMRSEAFEWFMGDLCRSLGADIRDCFANSFCVSADVTAAYDPDYPEVYEVRNDSKLNHGVAFCKYTGSGGKSGASDASAEVVGKLRKIMKDAGVIWQMTQLGKNDVGGGSTIAGYMANRNIDTIDAGVPVLSMHSPYETVAKLDCYMTYKCMKAVFESC